MSSAGISDPRLSAGPEARPLKRKRKVLACISCRRHKLRCDRERPTCGRCRTLGQSRTCDYQTFDEPKLEHSGNESTYADASYLEEVNLPHTWPPGLPSSTPTVLKDLNGTALQRTRIDRRPSALWSGVQPAAKIERNNVKTISNKVFPQLGANADTMIFRGSGYCTQYYGGTHPISSMAHFPDLQHFMKEAISRHTALAQVQRSLKALQVQWKQTFAVKTPISPSALFTLLPHRTMVDSLVNLYMDTYGSLYSFIHRPSFQLEYDQMWTTGASAEPEIVVTVLLMVAAVSCTDSAHVQKYIGDSSVSRERATYWIEVAESWLERQSQKNCGLAYWQIRCLLLIAKLPNTVKKKRAWSSAGDLLRIAISAGFHRDPAVLSTRMSPIDEELRRRLWGTMVELELQASVDRGMPSTSSNTPSDCGAVSNLDDGALTLPGGALPASRPRGEFTNASYLHWSQRSLDLRNTLTSTLNQLGSHPNVEDVLRNDEEIQQHLQDLAKCTLPAIVKTLLDIQLRQYLVMLHLPYARSEITSSTNLLSKVALLGAATSIIDQVSKLSATSRNAICFVRTEVFRSALSLCQVLHTSRAIKSDVFLQRIGDNCESYIEQVISRLDERITLLGTGYTHYWYISAAFGLLRASGDSTTSEVEGLRAVDRVTKQYYKVLASQDDIAEASKIVGIPRLSSTNDQTKLLATTMPEDSKPGSFLLSTADEPNFDEFFFGDPAAWTFDNLWPTNDLQLPDFN